MSSSNGHSKIHKFLQDLTHKNSRKRPKAPQNQTKKHGYCQVSSRVYGTTDGGWRLILTPPRPPPSTSPVPPASLALPRQDRPVPLAPRPPLQRRSCGASATCLGRPEDLLLLGCPGKEVSGFQCLGSMGYN